MIETQSPVATTGQEEVFEGRRKAVRAWEQTDKDIYVKGRALTGGTMKSKQGRLEGSMKVATLNVRGLNDVKLST